MTLLKTLLATALVAASLVSGAHAQDRTIKFAFQNQKDHPQAQGAQKFADLVAAKSGGKIQVKLFPGGTLGGDLQTVSALQGGTVEMTVLNAGILSAQTKEFGIYDFPFLFATPQEADAVTDGPFGKKLLDKLKAKNLVGLAYWELGFRNVTNSKKPITKAEDLAGLKIRVIQSPIYIDMFNALGANAVPMPFPELYTALEQKAVDGQENPVTTILSSKFNEVQKHLAITRHMYNPQAVIVSKKFWDGLSPAEQKWINDMHPRMVMHPVRPELNGQDLSANKDPNGLPLFMEFVRIVKTQGAGFVPYMWPKAGSDIPVEKTSYVKGCPA